MVQRWDGPHGVPPSLTASVVAIGVFDGVHRGHRVILDRARAMADRLGVPLVAVTFDPHPSDVVRPGTHPPRLSTLDHRVRLLGAAGADAVLVLPFTIDLSRRSPEDFAEHVLVDVLHARGVVVGENFRFGHRAAGDVALLTGLGEQLGFEVDPVALAGDADAWSSTRVRGHVASGEVEEAAAALGRPHRVEGVVVHGDHRGRDLGYPTANLDVADLAAVPADGVYAGYLVREPDSAEVRLPAAVSVGTNPTFGGDQRRVEAYVLDRDDLDLYSEYVAVDFIARLRPTLAFDSVEDLVVAMADDVARARAITAPAP